MGDNNEKDRIIDRIRKLMALSSSPEPGEAESAANMATRLMEQYEIGMADLRTGKRTGDSLIEESVQAAKRRLGDWEGTLAVYISRTFDCQVVAGSSPTTPLGAHLSFLGYEADVQLSLYFFKYLRRVVGRNSSKVLEKEKKKFKELFPHAHGRKAHSYGEAEARSYAFGMVSTLKDRLDLIYQKKEEMHQQAGTTDIVLAKKSAVEEFFKQKYPHTSKTFGNKRMGSSKAYRQGASDGQKVQLNRPVGGSDTKRDQIK